MEATNENNASSQFEMAGKVTDLMKSLISARESLGSVLAETGQNSHFNNKFVELSHLLKHVNPILARNGLGITQFPTGDTLVSILFHKDTGSYIKSVYKLILTKNDSQGQGSAITYARRYSIESMLAMAGGEDDDGNANSIPPKKLPEPLPPGKVTKDNAVRIAKEVLKEFTSVDQMQKYFSGCPQVMKNSEQVVEMFKARKAELQLKSK